ncbi:hypothetical protein [Paraflavitalea speifideaquila]|uniref:hypothetical protein n=1 Tax=Paraflavitalea speifideaquila TaxID=3076558 RepID=UPI0028EE3A62|nr:hypothetical protein [Paraflavitalea speifideiaquila]
MYRASILSNRKALVVRNIFIAFSTFLLLASPWIYLLYRKYGFLTFGYAAELNFKWTLLNRLEYQGSLLKAPPLSGSPCEWEDPSITHSGTKRQAFSFC